MSFEKKYNINPEFSDLFKFKSEKEELRHDAKMLMFRFLSEIEKVSDNLRQSDLAQAIKTTPSFVNQLFNGDKLANLITMAKLQKSFNIEFDIKAKPIAQNIFQRPMDVPISSFTDGPPRKTRQSSNLTFHAGGLYPHKPTEKVKTEYLYKHG
jgi:hypothetical protein